MTEVQKVWRKVDMLNGLVIDQTCEAVGEMKESEMIPTFLGGKLNEQLHYN